MKHSISKLAPTLIAIVGLNGFCSSVEAAQGNLYSGGENSHNIYKFTTAGVPPTVFYTNGMLNADSLAFDSKGNLFVADAGPFVQAASNSADAAASTSFFVA